jgi:hypothetical protein
MLSQPMPGVVSRQPMPRTHRRHGCPSCGSVHTQRASAVVEDRIRNAIAKHWAQAPGACGPDGTWLRGAVIVWIGALLVTVFGADTAVLHPWEWAVLLCVALCGGAWADRRVARLRGWIDPMLRAHDIVQQARERDALLDEAQILTDPAADDFAHRHEQEFVCLRCGHHFEPAPPVEALTA